MNIHEQQRFDYLYELHLTNLTLQGKRPATLDASHAPRGISPPSSIAVPKPVDGGVKDSFYRAH